MEVLGSPLAHIDICEGPDRLQTEISVTSTEMAGGSPPADRDICVIPEVLPMATSVKTVMSEKSMKMYMTMTMCTENGLDTITMITADSPRLTVTRVNGMAVMYLHRPDMIYDIHVISRPRRTTTQ